MEKDKTKTSNTTLPKDIKESNCEDKNIDNSPEVDNLRISVEVNEVAFLEKKLNELEESKIKQFAYFIDKNETISLDKKIAYLKILEINQNSIIAKVLINKEKRTFQKRRFDLTPFLEMDLKVNDFVEIEIITFPGQRLFNYTKIVDDTEIKPLFEKQNHFKDLENSELFKPLPIENEDNV